MAFNVSYIFEAVDRFSSTSAKIRASSDRLTSSFAGMQSRMKASRETMSRFGSDMSLKVTAPLAVMGGYMLKRAADLEQLDVAFGTMLGSADKGKKLLSDLINFAARTPFRLDGITQSTKTLLAMGFAQEEVMGTLQTLGDISAGTTKPLQELSVIFGQIKGAGRLMGQDLMQLVNAGVPIVEQLATMTGKTTKQIRKAITGGKVTFTDVQGAFVAMTQKGGLFFKLMDKQSRTLGGLFSTFLDVIDQAAMRLGKVLVQTFGLKDVLARVIVVVERIGKALSTWIETNPKIAKFVFLLAGILAVIGPIAVAAGVVAAVLSGPVAAAVLGVSAFIAALIVYWDEFKAALRNAWPFLVGMAAVMGLLTAPITAVGLAVAGLVAYWDDLATAMQNVINFWNRDFSSIWSDVKGLLGFGGDVNIAANQQLQGAVDVNVNVAGAPGTVKSVASKANGPAIGNLGVNMAGAGG